MKFIFALMLFLLLFNQVSGDTLRVATYNILNYNGMLRTDNLVTVIQSMNPDIIIVQEMINQTGVDSFSVSVLNSQYSTISFHDGDDTDNHLFYKGDKLEFFDDNYLSTALRDIAEYKMKIIENDDTVYFYSAHFKASQGSDNEQKRLAEATILRDRLNDHPTGTNFIALGDFNFYTSAELGYQKLIGDEADNDGRLFDPIDSPGTWHDDESFSHIHTQSTRDTTLGDGGATGGLDDRFDFLLISESFQDNVIQGTYTEYGNDGQHFNQSINEGDNDSVSSEIADALYYASDHLPLYCDFVFTATSSSEQINEVYYDSPGGDTLTFTELKGDPGTNLDGYNLIGVNGSNGSTYRTISLAGHTIPSDGYFVIAQDDGVENYDMIANVDWQNANGTGDNVILTDAWGDTVDALGYGPTDTSDWHFVGEGIPALDVTSGNSLGRYPDGTDTDTNSVDFAVFGSPTPGEANEYPPPLARSIYQIQYTIDPSGDSPYKDSTVVTSGIVTAGSGVFGSGGFYLQDGDGAWNGVQVYHNEPADSVGQGDSVTVTGVVDEYSGKTQITGVVELIINSTGNTLPNPAPITPGEVDTSEAYEGVLVKVVSVVVVDTMDGNGEWKVEGSDTCIVDDDGQYSYIPLLGDTLDITGVVNYSHGSFKIEPRYDADIDTTIVGVRFGDFSAVPGAFALSQNYPNPFNPVTQISFSLPEGSEARLSVYNISGQKVAELVSRKLEAGSYRVNWDGRSFASGVYFYRIEAGNHQMTKKMVLLK